VSALGALVSMFASIVVGLWSVCDFSEGGAFLFCVGVILGGASDHYSSGVAAAR